MQKLSSLSAQNEAGAQPISIAVKMQTDAKVMQTTKHSQAFNALLKLWQAVASLTIASLFPLRCLLTGVDDGTLADVTRSPGHRCLPSEFSRMQPSALQPMSSAPRSAKKVRRAQSQPRLRARSTIRYNKLLSVPAVKIHKHSLQAMTQDSGEYEVQLIPNAHALAEVREARPQAVIAALRPRCRRM